MSQSVQSVAGQIGAIFDTNNTPRVVCYVPITASASGTTTIVGHPPGSASMCCAGT